MAPDQPAPVEVVNAQPLAVNVVAVDTRAAAAVRTPPPKTPSEYVQRQSQDPSVPARTTFQEDLVAAGQRDINRIWETTQMKVALSVVWTALVVAAALAVGGKFLGSSELQLASVVFVYGVANLVTGFYFGRTNHTKTGGAGTPSGASR